MEKFYSLLTLKNIVDGIKKAYEKYKLANSGFWVTSLSFYSIVALVPISAILFSLGSWFGAKEYILTQITNSTPLPKDVVELISSFAENLLKNARNGVLAGIGFLFLGSTFLKMFSLIENSFNDIWHIKNPRTFIRKVSDYISFFIFLPLVFILLNGSLVLIINKIENISLLYQILSKTVPYISLVIFLSSLYMIMPNTTIKVMPALSAAIVISFIFYMFQIIFVNIQILINNYSIVYGSFSVLFIFLLWIRAFWFLIILGVHLSYFFQNLGNEQSIDNDIIITSFYNKLYVTLKIFKILVNTYLKNKGTVTLDELRKNIKCSSYILEKILEDLVKNDYLICGEEIIEKTEQKNYSITKNIDIVTLKEIYIFVAKTGENICILDEEIDDSIKEIILTENYSITLRSLGGE